MCDTVLFEKNRDDFQVQAIKHADGIAYRVLRQGQVVRDLLPVMAAEVEDMMKAVTLALNRAVLMRKGKKVTVTKRDIDILCSYFASEPDWSNHFFGRMMAFPLSGQTGSLALYLAWFMR